MRRLLLSATCIEINFISKSFIYDIERKSFCLRLGRLLVRQRDNCQYYEYLVRPTCPAIIRHFQFLLTNQADQAYNGRCYQNSPNHDINKELLQTSMYTDHRRDKEDPSSSLVVGNGVGGSDAVSVGGKVSPSFNIQSLIEKPIRLFSWSKSTFLPLSQLAPRTVRPPSK